MKSVPIAHYYYTPKGNEKPDISSTENSKRSKKSYYFSQFDAVSYEDQVYHRFKNQFLNLFIHHPAFKAFILIVIILNIIVLALDTLRSSPKEKIAYSIIDVFCVTIYVFEILINWFCDFFGYWTDGWNIFDFLIITISFIGLIIDVTFENSTIEALRVIKSLRVFPIVHQLIRFLPIHNTIFLALPMIFLIIIALFIILFIYAVLGLTIFSSDMPDLFGSLPKTLYTLFVTVTLENWSEVIDAATEAGVFASASIYFITYTTIMTVIAMTLIIGTLTSYMQQKRRELTRQILNKNIKNEEQTKSFSLKPPPGKNQLSWSTQDPINPNPSFHHTDPLSIIKMNHVLKAMEKNQDELDEQIIKLERLIEKAKNSKED